MSGNKVVKPAIDIGLVALIPFYNHSMSGNKVVKPAIDIGLVALILKD